MYTQKTPNHQFGFRNKHSTIQQIHCLCHTIYTAFEAKQYCTIAFLDISQAFDRVWHDGLQYKIKHILPPYYNLMRSYLSARIFHTRLASPRAAYWGPFSTYCIPQTYQRPTARPEGPSQTTQPYW